MQLLSPTDAAGRVTAALKSAAEATGAGFDYLLRTAKRESALDPTAKAPTSSARGLFQFIDQTWLQVLKEDGPALGLGDAAADVSRTASGRYAVADPARRAELLALRDDPQAAALLAGAFTRRNAATLQSALGRPATEGELYAAHFLGAQGAVQLVTLAANSPDSPAAAAFPAQASANRAIFYEQGRARSASEVYARLTTSPGRGSEPAAAPVALALQATAEPEIAPFQNGVENDRQPFHSLFKTGRRSPVSSYIAQTWSSFGSAGLVSDAAPARAKVAAATTQPAAVTLSYAPAAAPAAAGPLATLREPPAAEKPARSKPAVRTAAAEAPIVRAAAAAPLDLAAFRRTDLPSATPAPRVKTVRS
jgi:hypothetical protein